MKPHYPDTDGIHLPGQPDIHPDDITLTWGECALGAAVVILALACWIMAGFILINYLLP